MDNFLASCDKAANFPQNLVYHDTYQHNLRAYVDRLDERETQLFSKEDRASLDLQDLDAQTKKNKSTTHHNSKALQEYLTESSVSCCRYAFLHAPNSRERLYTSRRMFTYLLTYHQVMPSFLDFLFPFGRQETARDLNFSGFRHESRLEPIYNGLQISELGRSGRELRMCYSLKSVEPSEYNPTMPWSIRQTAVYHSLDVETGKTFWVIVKGDELIKERIEDVTDTSRCLKSLDGDRATPSALAASLAIHMVVCDWCGEDWRWYISYLEESFQEKTRHAMAVMVDTPASPLHEKPSKAVTWSTISSVVPEKQAFRANSGLKSPSPMTPMSPQQAPSLPPGPPPPPPSGARGTPMRSNTMHSQFGTAPHPTQFSFADLQKVQLVEDRANEVLLILESNINVLLKLKKHYDYVFRSEHCPKDFLRDCARDIERFEKRIASIINDLRIQQSRTQTLLRLVADRKSLLYGILEFQNMEASKLLALRAQESTENMEVMTKDMHILAQKTKQETVSMRIITLVTLFFLPGTFISTIMSTDIVQWQTDDNGRSLKVFQPGALQLFMTICLPLMLMTFAAWYGVYWWVDRKETLKRRSQLELLGEV